MSQGTAPARTCPDGLLEDVWDAMNRDPDVVLQLTDSTLPGHSQLLKIWSVPLGTAVDALPAAGTGERVVPVNATVKDWCTVASMLYPVAEPAIMSWDNVEAVAVLADKYNIPSLLQRAATFLEANMGDVAPYNSSSVRSFMAPVNFCRCPHTVVPTGQRCGCCGNIRSPSATASEGKDIWKWLQLSDRFGMARVTVACIGCIVNSYRSTATPQKVAGLSSAAKDLLLVELCTPGQAHRWKEQLPTDIKKQRLSLITEGLNASA